MIKNKWIKIFAVATLIGASACTNLEEKLYSSVTDEYFQDPENLPAAVAPVYASLRSFYHHENYWGFNQVASDETLVPSRGGDWYDGGKWLELNAHTWTSNHPHLPGLWNAPYTGIARANGLIESLAEFEQNDEIIKTQAEIRFLRAYYYFTLMDMFGNVPLVLVSQHNGDTPASSRPEVTEFVVSELEAVKDILDAEPEYGRVGQGAAYSLLAKIYLNAGVYFQDGSTVVAPTDAQLDKVIEYTTKVESMGYAVYPNYLETFNLGNEESNTDYIFYITYTADDPLGNHGNSWGVHYDTHKVKGVEWAVPSKWNGFSIMTDRYQSFNDNDLRKEQFYTEFEKVDGTIVQHEVELPLFDANKTQGVRLMKWEPDAGAVGVTWGGWSGNDFPIIRYADVLLMHAEALARKGNTGDAMAYINKLRTEGERFLGGAPEADAATHYAQLLADGKVENELDFILMERGWELCWEGVRRQDLIRHGKYLSAWQNKQMENDPDAFELRTSDDGNEYKFWLPSEGKASDGTHRLLFPIPPTQVAANPNLNQNDGY
ncbi:RagB/SusD family nutrient uptake outer membrane protein [Flammeovirga agarivorans]|uniref:RagB/SusD family nutrient uptake outer membrane protein n=1 Tax=Flammeovirga agarivorans TaxID=2726742 RepID=A0A7X8SPJ3_9BACT|nr:RagB/SusD family nutrient uptake outer membrane protein [Flammeovirga agarivorans]NLR93907.1 RagB/SusD family nutrient uptake outer membrane protein [Flammeovirga agarivorans]